MATTVLAQPVSIAPLGAEQAVGLACRVRLPDGRSVERLLDPWQHRCLQLMLLHRLNRDLVELTPGTRAPDGRLAIDRRWRGRHRHFLPGARPGEQRWLPRLLEHAQAIVDGRFAERLFDGRPREEAFVGVTPRRFARGGKQAVPYSRWLWVDIDRPERLDALWALLAERPCHMLVESAGSGGVHAYWRLDKPLPATVLRRETGELLEPIEQANLRLIHHLGSDADGRATVADPQCAERARVMRLAGTRNLKTGRYARIVQADLALAPYPIRELVGDLPDPVNRPPVRRLEPAAGSARDPYKQISPLLYFERLAGVKCPPHGGLVCCPAHDDHNPSCSVHPDPARGWKCHAAGCGAGGAIYDLASVLIGGPTGSLLRDEAFRRARAYVVDAFGELERTQRPGRRDHRPQTSTTSRKEITMHSTTAQPNEGGCRG